jgi:hypothetical protein
MITLKLLIRVMIIRFIAIIHYFKTEKTMLYFHIYLDQMKLRKQKIKLIYLIADYSSKITLYLIYLFISVMFIFFICGHDSFINSAIDIFILNK